MARAVLSRSSQDMHDAGAGEFPGPFHADQSFPRDKVTFTLSLTPHVVEAAAVLKLIRTDYLSISLGSALTPCSHGKSNPDRKHPASHSCRTRELVAIDLGPPRHRVPSTAEPAHGRLLAGAGINPAQHWAGVCTCRARHFARFGAAGRQRLAPLAGGLRVLLRPR
jgi:hypothetical protein